MPVSAESQRGKGFQPTRRTLYAIIADQRVRFLLVGGINTGLGYALFVVLDLFIFHKIPFGYLGSLIGSSAVAIVIAFILYRRFVFKVTGRVWSDFAKFVTVYLLAIGINFFSLPLLVELLGLNSLVAQALIIVVTTMISFLGHRRFSFRRAAEM